MTGRGRATSRAGRALPLKCTLERHFDAVAGRSPLVRTAGIGPGAVRRARVDKSAAGALAIASGLPARRLLAGGMDHDPSAQAAANQARIRQLRARIDSVEAQIAVQRELLQMYEARHWTREASLDLLRNLVESKATYRALLSALEPSPRLP